MHDTRINLNHIPGFEASDDVRGKASGWTAGLGATELVPMLDATEGDCGGRGCEEELADEVTGNDDVGRKLGS